MVSRWQAQSDLDGNRHDTGWIHAWTGANADFSGTDTRSVSASIDQIIARQISRHDRLPSLELALNDAQETGRRSPTALRVSDCPCKQSQPDLVEALWTVKHGKSSRCS